MSLKELRQQRALSMDAVAILAGLDTATISRIENGLVRPRPSTVVKLARGLGISAKRMNDILTDRVPV